jgi:hypothetical protein
MSRASEPQTEDESEWRFGIDDVGPDGIIEDSPVEEEPIEPGSPRTENVVFVLLGVFIAVALIFVTVFPGGA